MGVQKKYSTPQQHKDGMLSYLKGWKAPRIKSLIEQTPSETILLSRIYERCQFRHSLKPYHPTMRTTLASLPALQAVTVQHVSEH